MIEELLAKTQYALTYWWRKAKARELSQEERDMLVRALEYVGEQEGMHPAMERLVEKLNGSWG